jgi:hypothetical protein
MPVTTTETPNVPTTTARMAWRRVLIQSCRRSTMACDATDCDQRLHAFVGILCDACENFQDYCVEGIELNIAQINQYVDRSLMLVTAWSPVIGDDTA